ncbi:MAG TPA: hypothetical protein VIR30_05075 [Nocardioides sp.]
MDTLSTIGKGVVVLGIIGAVIWVIILAVQEQERWDAWCVDEGGRVDSVTSHGYGWTTGTNGKSSYGPVSTTTLYCLTDDGRIIDIYG